MTESLGAEYLRIRPLAKDDFALIDRYLMIVPIHKNKRTAGQLRCQRIERKLLPDRFTKPLFHTPAL